MSLGTLASKFYYNLPSDFLAADIIDEYASILDIFHINYYDSIVDYLNSTIKSISVPGLSQEAKKQTQSLGKERWFRDSKPLQDIVTSHDLNVVFASYDSDTNYIIMMDIIKSYYLDANKIFADPFTVMLVDVFNNPIYKLSYYEIICTGISDNVFDNSVQDINPKEFTVNFKFNYWGLENLLKPKKIINLNDKTYLGDNTKTILLA